MNDRILDIIIRIRNLSKAELKRLERDLHRLKNTNKKTSNSMKRDWERAGRTISRSLLVIGAAITGVIGLMVKFAAEAVESENLFRESMRKMEASARRWSDSLSNALGLNNFEIRKTLGTFNVMIKQMGFAEDAAFDMAKAMTMLGLDIASFYNKTIEESFTKLKSALVGMPRPLLELGLNLKKTQLETLELGAANEKLGKTMTEKEKVLARVTLLLKLTKTQQGDMARTMDTLVNVARRLWASLKLIAILIGDTLLPSIGNASLMILGATLKLRDFIKENRILVKNVTMAIAFLGGLAFAFGIVGSGIVALSFLAKSLGMTLGALSGFLGILTVKILLVVGAFVALKTMIDKMGGFKSFAKAIQTTLAAGLEKLTGIVIKLVGWLEKIWLVGKKFSGLKKDLELLKQGFADVKKELEQEMFDLYDKNADKAEEMSEKVRNEFEKIGKEYEELTKRILGIWGKMNDKMVGDTGKTKKELDKVWANHLKSLPRNQLKALKEMRDAFIQLGKDRVEVDKWYAKEHKNIMDGIREAEEEAMSENLRRNKKLFEDILFDGIRNGFRDAKDIARAFFDDLLRMAIRTFSNKVFSAGMGVTGGGGLGFGTIAAGIGSLIGGWFGGGSSGASFSSVGTSALGWATGNWSLFHKGGLIRAHDGLAPDEVPIIAQTGERILSRSQNYEYERNYMNNEGGAKTINHYYSIVASDPRSFGRLLKQQPEIFQEMMSEALRYNTDTRKTAKKYI
jgi:hypothetical protein